MIGSSQARSPFSNQESSGVSLILWTILLLLSTETPRFLMVSFISRSCEPCLKVQTLVKVVLRSTSKFGRLEHWCTVHFDHIQRSHLLEQRSSSTHFQIHFQILRQELVDFDPKDETFLLTKKYCKRQRNAITRKTSQLRKTHITAVLFF